MTLAGGRGLAVTEFGEIVVEHQRAAVELQVRVHDALAVVGHVPPDFLGAERLSVEVDGVGRLAVADREMGGHSARGSLFAAVPCDSPPSTQP